MLDIERFLTRSPLLYHMAAQGSWPRIREHGLLSTNALLSRTAGSISKNSLREKRKGGSISLLVDGIGKVILRDQAPLQSKKLTESLKSTCTVEEWGELLDSRVFLWAQRKSLDGLLGARNYRHQPQTIIEIDTRRFFAAYKSRIQIADINTGAVLHNPACRGPYTFQRIDTYNRVSRREIVEVTVLDGIRDISLYVNRVIDRTPEGIEKLIYGHST